MGEQGHFLETTPIATIKRNLDKLEDTGLPIHISEYDVNIADDNAQTQKYKELFPVLWRHRGVQGITLWGYKQGQIWREDAYVIRSDGSPRPALTWLTEYMVNSQGPALCDPVTSVTEEESPMRVYPNPARNGKFVVDAGTGTFQMRILDMQGQVKQEFHVTGNEPVSVHLKEPGLYFVQVFDGKQTTYKKITVN